MIGGEVVGGEVIGGAVVAGEGAVVVVVVLVLVLVLVLVDVGEVTDTVTFARSLSPEDLRPPAM